MEAYAHLCPSGWLSGPDDGYFFEHLAYHLQASEHSEELHRLLASETKQHRNAWYEAKESRGDISDYADDVQQASRLAENDYLPADLTRTAENISLQCRYALITSSVNHLSENVPPRLLHFLVKQGVWTLQKGISYARRVSNGWKRAEAMIAILPLLEKKTKSMQWWQETLAHIQAMEIGDGYDVVDFLVRSVISYPDTKPEEVIRTVLALIPENRKTTVFMKLEPYLSERLLVEGIECVRQHGAEASKLATLARRLPQQQRENVFKEIVDAARNTENVSELRDAFLALQQHEPLLVNELLSNILLLVTRFDFSKTDVVVNSSRLHLLIEVIPYLEEQEQERVLQRVLDLVAEVDRGGSHYPIKVLVHLASRTPMPLRDKVLAEAQCIKGLGWRIDALAELAPYLEGEQRERTLKEILQTIHNDAERLMNENMRELFHYMSSASLQDVLVVAKRNLSGIWKVRVLTDLAERLASSERERVLHEALKETKTINLPHEYSDALSLLAPLLSAPLLEEALMIAQVINEGTGLLHGFSYWLASIPDAVREQAGRFSIRLLPYLKQEWAQVQWIDELAPYWPEALQADALALVRAYQESANKAKALATLARSMMAQELEREKVLLEALAEVENINYIRDRAEALAKLARVPCPAQSEAVVQRALDVLVELDDRELQAPILAQLAPVIPIALREQVILATLVRRTKSLKGRGVLQTLAPHFSEQVVWNLLHDLELKLRINSEVFLTKELHKLISLSFVIEDREVDEICLALLVRLAELGDPISAYKIAMGRWVKEATKVEMVAALAPYLPSAQSEEALQMVLQVPGIPEYEPALAKLCIRIAEFTDGENVLSHVQEMKNPRWQAHALVGIAPYLKGEVQHQVLREALTTTLQTGFSPERHRLLAQLSLQLAQWPLSALYELWRAIFAQLTKRYRMDVVAILFCLNPVLTALRGSEFPMELFQTIEDILRWWL